MKKLFLPDTFVDIVKVTLIDFCERISVLAFSGASDNFFKILPLLFFKNRYF